MKERSISILGMFFLMSILCWPQTTNTSLFKIQTSKTTSLNIKPTLFETSGIFPLPNTTNVYGLSVSGRVVLKDETNSMVRITAECPDGIEYLVYETHPLLTDVQEFDIQDMAFETAILQAENVAKLNITLLNASFFLQDVKYASSAPERALRTRQILQKEQETAIIERLNENLEKNKMLWRAGNTSISNLSYEQKKAMFGDSMPYLGGFEYYVGGVFVMPGYDLQATNNATTTNDNYVKEWDWRNRHGKNWMTPVKNQGNCGSCWDFAAIGSTEAYINIYYNHLYHYNLSEQHILSCGNAGNCANGGYSERAFQFIKDSGVVLEDCFPYTRRDGFCNDICLVPNEKIQIEDILPVEYIVNEENDIKSFLFRAPFCFGINSWWHIMILVGFKKIDVGDTIWINNNKPIEIIEENSLVGKTVWLLKNSWGTNWGDEGYAYIYPNRWLDIYQLFGIQGNIKSLILNPNDIQITDNDGDGYYVWGIGERPTFLPDGSHLRMDGDDSSPQYGPIDKYGQLETITSPITIQDVRYWDFDEIFNDSIVITSSGTLHISGNIELNSNYSIIVHAGGSLILDGGTIKNTNIIILKDGCFQIINNGRVEISHNNIIKIDRGASCTMHLGSIEHY